MDENSVREFMKAWHTATIAEDRDALRALIAPDAVFLIAKQEPMIGWTAFAASFDQATERFRITPAGQVRDILFSGDLACCWTELKITLTPRAGGDPIVRTGTTLTILQRAGQGWQLVRDANLLS